MLVIAFAGFNIEQAVIYQTCENVNHSIHLIPQARSILIDLKQGLEKLEYHLSFSVSPCNSIINTNPGSNRIKIFLPC